MPEMKNSGINYIGMIPIYWQIGKIKHIVSTPVMTGAGEEAQDKTSNSIRYIRISDFDKNGNVIEDNAAYIPKVKGEKYILPKGVILAATAGGTVGKTLFFEGLSEPACYAGYLAKIETNPNKMLNKFLLYQMRCQIMDGFRVYSVKKSIIENISATAYSNMPIIFPPLEVQKSIANFLDKKCSEIDSLSADIQSQIDVLEEYKKSAITEAVTKGLNPDVEMRDSGIEWVGMIPKHWEIKRTKYIANSLSKGNGITKDQVFDDGDIQCVRYGEIYSKYEQSFDKTSSLTKLNQIASPKYIQYGDILFAGTGELIEEIGKNVVFLGNEPCLAGGDIVVLKHSHNPRFLNYALNSTYSQEQKSKGKAKLKVVHVSVTDIGNILITLPPNAEQDEIAEFLDKTCNDIDMSIADKKSQLETLAEYKKSLIYEYVTGKKEVKINE